MNRKTLELLQARSQELAKLGPWSLSGRAKRIALEIRDLLMVQKPVTRRKKSTEGGTT